MSLGEDKQKGPFKYNPSLEYEKDFQKLVKGTWKTFYANLRESSSVHLSNSIHLVKDKVIPQDSKRNKTHDKTLKEVEHKLEYICRDGPNRIHSE